MRLLFGLLVLNSMLGLVTGEFGVATFIKNRLELSSIRNVIADFLRAAILLIAFSCFAPHVWYIGLSGLILTGYTVIWNIKYRNRLTPDLRVNIKNFDLRKVKELISSGVEYYHKAKQHIKPGIGFAVCQYFCRSSGYGYILYLKDRTDDDIGADGSHSEYFRSSADQLLCAGSKRPDSTGTSEIHKGSKLFLDAHPLLFIRIQRRFLSFVAARTRLQGAVAAYGLGIYWLAFYYAAGGAVECIHHYQ